MRRRAFTLIEVMIVIGVMALLVTLVAYAMSKVINRSKIASTKITLDNLNSMVMELQTTSKGLNKQPAGMWQTIETNPATPLWTSALLPINIWREGDPTDNGVAVPPPPEPDPIYVPVGNLGRDVALSPLATNLVFDQSSQPTPTTLPPPRYGSNVIANTQLVMGLLAQTSNNKKAMEQIPASQLLETIPIGVSPTTNVRLSVGSPPLLYGSPGITNYAPNPAMILDAWGHPILFVPAGGLCGSATPVSQASMWVGGPPDTTFKKGQKMVVAVVTNALQQVGPIKSRDNRPFWASAGPDGDFRTADDNIYSFEN